MQHDVVDATRLDHPFLPRPIRRTRRGDDTLLSIDPHKAHAVDRARSEEAGATGPLSLRSVRNSDQSRGREPITVEMRSRGAQMKLPNYSDALPSKQPRRDGLQ
jgi:hypothetical protein